MTQKYLKAWHGTLGAVLILVIVAVGIAYVLDRPVENAGGDESAYDRTPTTGRLVCLTPKGALPTTDGPCTIGLLGDDGLTYALDFSGLASEQTVIEFYFDKPVKITGALIPTTELGGDIVALYDIAGLIEENGIFEISTP